LEQLDADLPHAAADVEHGGTGDAVGSQEVDHPGGGRVQAATAEPPRHVAGEGTAEHLVAPARVAAPGHGSSLPPGGPGVTRRQEPSASRTKKRKHTNAVRSAALAGSSSAGVSGDHGGSLTTAMR